MINAYIPNAGSDNVSVVDTSTNTIIATIAVGANPVGSAVTPDGNKAYITNGWSGTVSVIDTSSNSVAATITVGSNAQGVALTPNGAKAYATSSLPSSVSVIDTASDTVIASISIPNSGHPHGVAFTPDGTLAYITDDANGVVLVVDTATNTIITGADYPITVGSSPEGVGITPDGTKAYVANTGGTTVSVIDIASHTVTTTITVGGQPTGVSITPDGTKAYVTNQLGTSNSVSVIDVATDTVSKTVAVGSNPVGVSVTPDGAAAYVANYGSRTISVIDTSTDTVSDTINLPSGSYPTAFGQFIQPPSISMTSIYTAPQGRLTLTSNTPVMAADALAATSIYYTPYQGNIVPIYDGANMQSYSFGQLTMALNSSNQTSGHIYDLFAFLNSSVVTIGAGPAWSSSTARGTGAGTTELQQVDGLWVNANTITLKNGSTTYSNIPVGEATYLGSVYMSANGQTQFNIKPAAASGGTNNIVGIWNAYNRVSLKTICRDSSGYTYASNTWRKADNNANNRISFLDGLGQSSVAATFINSVGTAATGTQVYIGLNLNSTSATPNLISFAAFSTSTLGNNYNMLVCEEAFPPALGFNYYQAMENSVSSVTATFNALGKDLSLILDCEY